MPIIPINGKKVHVQELNKGAAETVVMVHGMFSNLSVYYFNIAPLLALRFHVVLYDLKSHGMSERTRDGYDLDSMSDDLRALMDALGLEKVHLVGYSFGALISLKAALRFPGRIDRLIMIEGPDPADDKTRGIMDEYSREFLEHYIRNFTDATKVQMGKRQLERNHRMYEYLFYQTTIKQDMLAEKDFFSSDAIAGLEHHPLLIYGSRSNCLRAGYFLKERIPGAELEEIEGDHNVPVQAPEAVAGVLLHFLTEAVPVMEPDGNVF
ncbi:alpha/beta fold hydrolase [Niabella beijingensis]|uniref:alpha/beta fold hydrolase n=1 Tax=Niabella beijingensis TaxID=2872700 RepID=UPI001CBDD75E|nr:alpha/beta hydrolase [Niabella beijingensis]MBZ4192499.1 alpha/beta hydrolase [Niabella beijingensis]